MRAQEAVPRTTSITIRATNRVQPRANGAEYATARATPRTNLAKRRARLAAPCAIAAHRDSLLAGSPTNRARFGTRIAKFERTAQRSQPIVRDLKRIAAKSERTARKFE